MEQKKRIDYIDALKGFAILLVVMGHVLANVCHDDWNAALQGGGQSMILWKFIYSFHMPLFMFCSGLVFKFENTSIANSVLVVKKRFMGLILPYLGMGAFAYILLDKFAPYWYLYTLFVFYTITLVIYLIMSKFKWYKGVCGTVFLLFWGLLVQFLCIKFRSLEIPPLLDLSHFGLYFFFCLGIIFKKHQMAKYCGAKSFSIVAVFFFVLFLYEFNIIHFPNIRFLSTLLSRLYTLSAILFFYTLFLNVEKGSIFGYFEKIGLISLEIYILHPFFLPKLSFFENVFNSFDLRSSIIVQFFVSLFLSLLLIGLCKILTKIPQSPFRKVLFGK
jgi:fucose 4-O-acetylase-like acetyltransferase